jgi:hypothetical protein
MTRKRSLAHDQPDEASWGCSSPNPRRSLDDLATHPDSYGVPPDESPFLLPGTSSPSGPTRAATRRRQYL